MPAIFQAMQENIQQEQRVLTREIIRQIFIEAFVAQQLPWQPSFKHKRFVGEFIATPLLQKLEKVLQPVIEQIQQEGMLVDQRKNELTVY